MRVLAHLVSNKPAPPEWLEFVLADRFNWTLTEIRALPLVDVLRLFTLLGAESEYQKAKHG